MTTTIGERVVLTAQIAILFALVAGLGFAVIKIGDAQEPGALAGVGIEPVSPCAQLSVATRSAHAPVSRSPEHASTP
jgi:hypothetical protein